MVVTPRLVVVATGLSIVVVVMVVVVMVVAMVVVTVDVLPGPRVGGLGLRLPVVWVTVGGLVKLTVDAVGIVL